MKILVRVLSVFAFLLVIVGLFYTSTLVSEGKTLSTLQLVAGIVIATSFIFLMNFWTGRPYVDLGKRVLGAMAVFVVCYLGSCSSERVKTETTELQVGNSRFYIGYSGDQGALGYNGMGVFQEKKLVDSIYRVKELCFFPKEDDQITMKFIEPNQLECKSNHNQYMVEVSP